MQSRRHFAPLLLVVALLLGISAAISADTSAQQTPVTADAAGCNTLYFWRLNPEAWPVETLQLGTQSYTRPELVALMNSQISDDLSVDLLRQAVTAKLNAAAGCVSPEAEQVILSVDGFLAAQPERLPLGIASDTPEGQQISTLLPVLRAVNNAIAGDDLEVSVVIEGPIQSITNNIIVIYDIEIELDPREPILTILRIGDLIRIEGTYPVDGEDDDDDDDAEATATAVGTATATLVPSATVPATQTPVVVTATSQPATQIPVVVTATATPATPTPIVVTATPGTATPATPGGPIVVVLPPRIRLIAIVIILIRVEYYVSIEGIVYREEFGCGNPPPPWAPAWGWRRRCQNVIVVPVAPLPGGYVPAPPGSGGGSGGGGDDDDDD
ncbi:MAG: hypothetical protein SF029_01190 [bacterium]|nr:hypothetical protein [bacterium]